MNNFNKKLLGIWLYIITDCITFSILFLSFLSSKKFYLKNEIFNYRSILLESIFLLFCSYLTIKILSKPILKFYLLILLFSFLFLLLEFKDFYHLNYLNINFKLNNFLSNYNIIIFLHAFHVLISIFICFNIIYLNKKKLNFKLLNIFFSLFWHFIHIIWLIIIFIIYIK